MEDNTLITLEGNLPDGFKNIKSLFNPNIYIDIVRLYSILAEHGFHQIDYELEPYLWLDIDLDPQERIDDILDIFVNHAREFLITAGIVVNENGTFTFNQITELVYAITLLESMSLEDLYFVSNIMEEEGISDIEKIFVILTYLNPLLRLETLENLVKDVMPKFIDYIRQIIENKLPKLETDEDYTEIDEVDQNILSLLKELGSYLNNLNLNISVDVLSIILDKDFRKTINRNINDLLSKLKMELGIKIDDYLTEEELKNTLLEYIDILGYVYYRTPFDIENWLSFESIPDDIKIDFINKLKKISEIFTKYLPKEEGEDNE